MTTVVLTVTVKTKTEAPKQTKQPYTQNKKCKSKTEMHSEFEYPRDARLAMCGATALVLGRWLVAELWNVLRLCSIFCPVKLCCASGPVVLQALVVRCAQLDRVETGSDRTRNPEGVLECRSNNNLQGDEPGRRGLSSANLWRWLGRADCTRPARSKAQLSFFVSSFSPAVTQSVLDLPSRCLSLAKRTRTKKWKRTPRTTDRPASMTSICSRSYSERKFHFFAKKTLFILCFCFHFSVCCFGFLYSLFLFVLVLLFVVFVFSL